MLKHARRATLALTTSALLATTVATGPVAQAADSDVTPRAASTADWLASQLDDGLVISEYRDFDSGEFVQYTDHGLSLDFLFAFKDLGVKPAVRKQILAAIEPQVDAYVAPFGVTYAGALGKLLAAVQVQGINPRKYSDSNQLRRLQRLVHTDEDSELGRAEDGGSTDETDSSNTVGHSFVVQALAAAGSGLADESLEFLLKQQCSDGFFRVYMESSDHTCDSGTAGESTPSVDATAAAVLALIEVKAIGVEGVRRKVVNEAIAEAQAWLVGEQAQDGSFSDEGVANSNSTGLATQALHELGRDGRAAAGASWIAGLQVTGRLVRRTEFAPRDEGAIALSPAALDDGKQDGITRDDRYEWRRATAQSVVALDSTTS